MRIAFTSCFSAQLFPNQPVWQEIRAARPHVLVILGDSIYLDCGGPYNTSGVQQLTAYAFATHAHQLYQRQLDQPDFKALLKTTGLRAFAIWDDHDFLWNDACGANVMANPAQAELVYPSRAAFDAYRQALAGAAYPTTPAPWTAGTPPPGYQCVDLGSNVFLHLTDGRSWRKRGGKALLGKAQLQQMASAMAAAGAGATHLLASATVVEARNGEAWMKCDPEYQELLRLAQQHDILVLSGDIHDNNLASYKAGNRSLFETTASGAALKTGVVIGSLQRNWGLLDIDANSVDIKLFKAGATQYSGTISRAQWQ